MSDRYFQHTYPNGLVLLGERMTGMKSVAMTLLVPAGVSTDPAGQVGVSTVLSDLILRGAGPWDSRGLTDHLDSLGLQRSSTVGVYHTRLGAAAVGDRLLKALPAYSAMLTQPHLPEDGFEAARDLSLQALAGLDDDPRQKLLVALREAYFPGPLGRNVMGIEADMKSLTLAAARAEHARRFVAQGAILSVAGDVDEIIYRDAVGAALGTLPPRSVDLPRSPLEVGSQPRHVFQPQPSEQTHIGIAYPSVPETHDDYYAARLAVEVLSGGMSGRLFTEVREKRGLCYSVWAGYSSLIGLGAITGYAGTSNERAQATLDCLIAEIQRLSDGVTEAELTRARTGLKSSLIMSGESTSGRAAALAHDYFVRGRLRTLDEISQALDGVTVDRVNAYLRSHPPGPFTTVIVGPKDLSLPS